MDRRTLFAMQAGLLLFLGGVILLAFRKRAAGREDPGARWFGFAYLCAGTGLALQAERGRIPAVFSILLGNFLFMLFGALANRAVALTTRQRSRTYLYLIALDVALIANFTYYTYFAPNLPLRVVEAAVTLVVMHIALIATLLSAKDRVADLPLRCMAGLLSVHAGAGLLRIALADRFSNAEIFFSWTGLVTIAGLAICYLWMDSLRVHAELEASAMTDPLTGLFNRRALDVLAPREIARATRANRPCSALMMDLDRFKKINDSLGHTAGDASLRAVAGLLQAELRSCDVATRLGGDEFFVLLPDCDEEHAGTVRTRLQAAVNDLRLQTMGGTTFRLSVSIGQATQHHATMTVTDLLHASDIVLYQQKMTRDVSRVSREVSRQADTGGAQVQPSNA